MAFGVWHTLLLYQVYILTKLFYVNTLDYYYHEKHEQIRIIVETNLELFKNKLKQIGVSRDFLVKYNLNNKSDIVKMVVYLVDDLNETEARTFWLRMNPNFVSDYDTTTDLFSRRNRPPKHIANVAAFAYMKTTTIFPPEEWATRNKTFIHNQYKEIYQVLYDNNIIVTRNTRKTKSKKRTLPTTTEPEIIPPKNIGSEEDEDYSMPPMESSSFNDTGMNNSAEGPSPTTMTEPTLPFGRCGPEKNESCFNPRPRVYDDTIEEEDETIEAPGLMDDDISDTQLNQGQQALLNMQKFGYVPKSTGAYPNNNYYYQGKQFYYGDQNKKK